MTPNGWYADHAQPGEQRYWDGQQWTSWVTRLGQTIDERAVAAAPATPAPAARVVAPIWTGADRLVVPPQPIVATAPPLQGGPAVSAQVPFAAPVPFAATVPFAAPAPAATDVLPPASVSPATSPAAWSPAVPPAVMPPSNVPPGGSIPAQAWPGRAAGPSPKFVFTGTAGEHFGISLAGFFITLVTLGFCRPWAIVMRQRWITQHTLVDGRRLQFNGRGGDLWWRLFKWGLLTLLTLGIYTFWAGVRQAEWVNQHTFYDDHPGVVPTQPFAFVGTAGENFANFLGSFLLALCTLGFGIPWALVNRQRWATRSTLLQGTRLRFLGTGGQLLWLEIKMLFLMLITLGIYGFWVRPRLIKWVVESQSH